MSIARLLQVSAVLLTFAILVSVMIRERDTPVPRPGPMAGPERAEPAPLGAPPPDARTGADPRAREGDAAGGAQSGRPQAGQPGQGQGGQAAGQPPPIRIPPGLRLGHGDAMRTLRAAGIDSTSSGGCGDRTRSVCTSLEGIRRPVIEGLIEVRRRSGCHIVVTGGTETGHAEGTYSHGQGYKVDIVPDECVSKHIQRNGRYVGQRGDGAETYRGPDGTMYYREPDHWDIMVR